jgi:phytoene dehydrogenase-like protein
MGLFALQTPTRLFDAGAVDREAAVRACLDSLQSVLVEPIEDCILTTADGEPCLSVHLPEDLERDLAMPGGNIFHGDLQWPWAEDDHDVGRWGVETELPNVFVCSAGARRGGGVSGIGGHNAAMAALAYLDRRAT